MSCVDNLIVTCECGPEHVEQSVESLINTAFGDEASLVKVDQLNRGSKAMECNVWIAAVNYLDRDRLAHSCREASAAESTLQVFINGHGDDFFWLFFDRGRRWNRDGTEHSTNLEPL